VKSYRLLAIGLVFAVAIAIGLTVSHKWVEDPTLTHSDYIGTVEVEADDAKLYRAVPFEWRIEGRGGRFKGNDTAFVRVDPSGERTMICGWLKLDPSPSPGAGVTGTSVRASRWLSQAHLKVGDLFIAATFIAPGGGKEAGCAGLFDNLKPAADSALALDGPAVPE
jgi:hypothetical protein